jgi:hypothetical protein
MLTPSDFEKIAKQAEKIYSELELEIIKEIAERIANVGYGNTVVLNDIKIAQEMGIMYQDIINLVAKYNEASVSQIQEIFDTAGAQTLKFDDKIYKEAGLIPLPLKQSPSMIQLLSATAKKTHNNLSNLVMTTATASQTEFYNAMNKAYMEVSTSVKSYSEAILDSVKAMGNKGAYITYPSGQHRSIESAVRMNVLTSVNQTCGKLQELRADEMGWDLMELTAHSGARPEHAEWQGKIVSRSGQKGYLSLDDIGYGEVTGFKGVNCRHDWMPYYKGSTRTYTNQELNELKNEKVSYNGKNISKYEATQIQRRMERQIRNDKKEIAGLEGILRSNTTDDKLIEETKNKFNLNSYKLKEREMQLNDFIQQTSLKRDISRERIDSTNRSTSQKIVQGSKVIERNKEMWYNNTVPLGKQLVFEDNVNKNNYIPKNTTITNVTTIAGEDLKEFRNASLYVEKYGGNLSDWEKRVGKVESSKYIFDIHWVQSKTGILTEWKITNVKEKEGE